MLQRNGELSGEELLKLGRQLVWSRPLTPYPGWHFSQDFDRAEPSFQMRKVIWSYFRQRNEYVPFTMPWYHGLQLQITFSNDLSQQIFVCGCIEPNEMAFLDRFLLPGMSVIDVGANEGLFTLLSASRVGREGKVWAFEPSPREWNRLQTNVQLNDLQQVQLFSYALANQEGTASFKVAECVNAGHNTLGDFVYNTVTDQIIPVKLKKLDDVVQEKKLTRIDFMKIDVEGAETQVLLGAKDVLQNHRPTILLEILEPALNRQRTSGKELLDLLQTHGYQIYCFNEQTGRLDRYIEGKLSDNIVAHPQEKPVPTSF